MYTYQGPIDINYNFLHSIWDEIAFKGQESVLPGPFNNFVVV